MDLRDLLKNPEKYLGECVTVNGWIRNHRDQKTFGFIDFSDGTCQEHLQIVYDAELENFEEIRKFLVGCAIEVTGKLVESTGNQKYRPQTYHVH